jgi:hypothetical protein
MPNHLGIAEAIQVFRDRFWWDSMKLAQKLADQLSVWTFGDDFNAIAGRQNHHLADCLSAYEGRQRFTQRIAIEGKSFANLDRSRLMTESNQSQLHY